MRNPWSCWMSWELERILRKGASLAIAILEDPPAYEGSKTMATTHYPELKAYGIETWCPKMPAWNLIPIALSPTYRFMQGVPGRSNAFEIARRLGL